jgi:preprotein translocase subunit SecF
LCNTSINRFYNFSSHHFILFSTYKIVIFLETKEVENEDVSDGDVEGSMCGENARIAKYRSLLSSIQEKNKKEKGDVEMEITWGVGLKEKAQQIVNERQKPELSHFEKIVEKKKAKNKEKKMKAKESTKVSHGAYICIYYNKTSVSIYVFTSFRWMMIICFLMMICHLMWI